MVKIILYSHQRPAGHSTGQTLAVAMGKVIEFNINSGQKENPNNPSIL
jgi:hypothetical protein